MWKPEVRCPDEDWMEYVIRDRESCSEWWIKVSDNDFKTKMMKHKLKTVNKARENSILRQT